MLGKLEVDLKLRPVLFLEAQQAADLVVGDLIDDSCEINDESGEKGHVWVLTVARLLEAACSEFGNEGLVAAEGLKIPDEYLAKLIIELIQPGTVFPHRFVTGQR